MAREDSWAEGSKREKEKKADVMALFHNDLPCSKGNKVEGATNSQMCARAFPRASQYTFTTCSTPGAHTPDGFRLAETKGKVAFFANVSAAGEEMQGRFPLPNKLRSVNVSTVHLRPFGKMCFSLQREQRDVRQFIPRMLHVENY